MNQKRKFGIVGHTLMSFGTDILTYVLAFLTSIVVARPLGPAGRGAFAIITMFNSYIVSLFQLGMGSAAEMQIAKKEYPLETVHGFAVLFSFCLGIFTTGLFSIVHPWLFHSFLGNADPKFCWLAVLAVPFTVYSLLTGKILIGLNEISVVNSFRLLRGIYNLAGFVLLLFMFHLGLTGAIIVWTFEAIIISVAQGWWLLKMSHWRLNLNWKIIRESFSFGWKVHFAFIPASAIQQMDGFVLNNFHGPQPVGLFSIASNSIFRIGIIFNSVLTASQAKIIGYSKIDSERLIRRLIRHSVFLAGMISIFLFFTAHYLIVLLYGKAYFQSGTALIILSFSLIMIAVTNFLDIYVVGQLKKPGLSGLVNWTDFFLGLGIYFFLIPKYGLIGTAWAYLLIWSIKVIGYLWLLRWFSPRILSETFLIKLEDFLFWKQKISLFLRNFPSKLKSASTPAGTLVEITNSSN